MTRLLCEKYVAKHGRYHEDAPENAKYSVRYPLTSSISFFADDTFKLVELVFKKAKGKDIKGKKITKGH